MKTVAGNRFESARKRLSDALHDLEKILKQKIHQAAIESRIINHNETGARLETKVFEQAAMIQTLNQEINNLQKLLSDLGGEIEFISEKNKIISKKTEDFRIQGPNLIKAIESDIARIEDLLK
jgi:predicted  nucleic acid-binding Zn-ribbon protein